MSAKPLLSRWWMRLLLGLLVLGLVAFLARNLIVRKGLEAAVTEVTGFPLAIDSFALGILDSKVVVKGMRLSNPPGFEDPRCIGIRRLAADVELGSAFGDELHIEEIDLDIEEVVVVRSAGGETNLDRLAALGGGGEGGKAKEEGPAKQRKWRCDRLHLRLPKVVFLDYSSMRDGKPKREVYDLRVDETFRNVRGPEEVVKIIVLKVVAGTPIRLVRASVETLTRGLGDVHGGAAKGVGGVVEGVGGAIGGVLGVGGDDGKKEPEPAPKKKAPRKK